MTVTVTPHLNFRGQAREALEHYRDAFGGELAVVTFEDAHSVTDPAEAEQVIFGQVTASSGFSIMAFDVPAARSFDRGEESFFVSVRVTDADELTTAWERLSQGATVRTPLGPSQWSPLYGMLTDRFGVTWVMDVTTDAAA